MRSVLVVLAAMTCSSALVFACSSSDESPSDGVDSGVDASTSPRADAGADAATTDASTTDASTTTDASDASTLDASPTDAGADAAEEPFVLTSVAFADGASIPARHTCEGPNLSPALSWSGAPAGTLSYAIVVRDTSLATTDNFHWVIYDIPANVTSLAEGVVSAASPAVPAGAKQTYWSFGAHYGYGGPCPPPGAPHLYQFQVLALSTATAPVPGGTTDPGTAHGAILAAVLADAKTRGQFQR